MTISIQIGNSDNKLTQLEWSRFIVNIQIAINNYNCITHFSGGPPTFSEYQNYGWIIEINNLDFINNLKNDLIFIRKKYNQDSIAWTEGETKFI